MRESVKIFFKKEIQEFNNFVSQVRNDSTGRFFVSKDGRKNNAFKLGREIFTEEQFINYLVQQVDKECPTDLPEIDENAPTITVLVGPPASGKSSHINKIRDDAIVLSRDDILLQHANSIGFKGTYSEVWKYFEENNLHKIVDEIEQETFKKAVKDKKNIIVDRTNMSRKSRRRWLSNVPKDYRKEAVVFATTYEDVYSRNKKRTDETGKSIPNEIIGQMMRQFMVPCFDEVDEVKWVF